MHAHKRARLSSIMSAGSEASSQLRNKVSKPVSQLAEPPAQWPLAEAYSQRELLRALKPKRRAPHKSDYYRRFHIFTNTANTSSSSRDQANAQPLIATTSDHSHKRCAAQTQAVTPSPKRPSTVGETSAASLSAANSSTCTLRRCAKRILPDTLDQDDLEFISKHSKLTGARMQGTTSLCSTTGTFSLGSTNHLATNRRNKHVQQCVNGDGFCPKTGWTIDQYCPACHG